MWAQENSFELKEYRVLPSVSGDEINSFWITNNTICFQNSTDNKNNLYIYTIDNDSLRLLYDGDFKNPVLHPGKEYIVFNKSKDSMVYLYKVSLQTGESTPLFHRNIQCRNASFSDSDRQVYFTGLDEITNKWEIYSYDFVYDNLNKLTPHNPGSDHPDVSNDGKEILYCKKDPFTEKEYIKIINWYGEPCSHLGALEAYTPQWGNNGLKIYYVAGDKSSRSLYSIWKDNTHLQKLTGDSTNVLYPSISPDGRKIALSVFNEKGYDIILYELW